jgi:prepilin signal peptidase PulO-like enzyme (type II secretory pathway)
VNPVFGSLLIIILGACIGSFLNVVIYRNSRGLSIRKPSRSFCPACEKPIVWYDNIPVLSYLLLGGRCRHCKAPISIQYPLVELATALVFLMTWHVFFVAGAREGIGRASLPEDSVILIAHLVLWSGLIVLTALDLESYTVDINVTYVISAVGILAHMLWTRIEGMPPGGPAAGDGLSPGAVVAAMSFGTAVGLAIGAWVFLRGRSCEAEVDEPVEEATAPENLTDTAPAMAEWLRFPVVLLGVAAVATYFILSVLQARPVAPLALVAMGIGQLFLVTALAAAYPHAEADAEIVETIHEEAPDARRNAMWELKLLSPAVVLGFAAVLAAARSPVLRENLHDPMAWDPLGHWRQLLGLATGLTGWIIAGGLAWFFRVFFTLLLGKEALGMGDIHILAAVGAVAGWPAACLGFFLAAPLALLALIVIRIRRQGRALPFVPWLALGAFVAGLFQDRILGYLVGS